MEPTKERFEQARKIIRDLCHGRRKWEMSIPARPDDDPDLILGGLLHDCATAIAGEGERSRLLRERLNALVESCTDASPRQQELGYPDTCAPSYASMALANDALALTPTEWEAQAKKNAEAAALLDYLLSGRMIDVYHRVEAWKQHFFMSRAIDPRGHLRGMKEDEGYKAAPTADEEAAAALKRGATAEQLRERAPQMTMWLSDYNEMKAKAEKYDGLADEIQRAHTKLAELGHLLATIHLAICAPAVAAKESSANAKSY